MRKRITGMAAALALAGGLLAGPLAPAAGAAPARSAAALNDKCIHIGLITLCFPY